MKKQKSTIIQHKPTLKEFILNTDNSHTIFDKGYFNSDICIVIHKNSITPYDTNALCEYLLQFEGITISTAVKDSYVIELNNKFIIIKNER